MITKILASPSRRFVGACLLFLIVMAGSVLHEERKRVSQKTDLIRLHNTIVSVNTEVVQQENTQEFLVKTGEGVLVAVRLAPFPSYHYGDVLHLSCKTQQATRYDRMRGVAAHCFQGSAYLLRHENGTLWKRTLYALRSYVREKVQKLWPEPYAAFIAGVLYGERANLPKDLTEQFRTVGLTHIMAVSGYNITIIANFCMAVLRLIGMRRKRSFFFVTCLVAGFVVFVGSSASAVRAGVMGIVALLGKTIGRGSHAAPVLAATAVAMTAYEPMTLLFDAGFHLSMLATIGLIYGSPVIARRLQWIPERFGLRELIATSLAALIATAPFISWQFGTASVVGLVANFLVVPIVPLLMIGAAAAVAVSIISVYAGILIAGVAWLICLYCFSVVSLLSRIPHATVPIQIPFVIMLILYTLLIIWIYRERTVSSY